MASDKPACAGDSVSCLEMNGASGPNIIHAVKPVSKYRKHANRAFQLPLRNELNNCFMTGFLWNGTIKNAANGTHARADVRVGGVASFVAERLQRLCHYEEVSRTNNLG